MLLRPLSPFPIVPREGRVEEALMGESAVGSPSELVVTSVL